MKYFRVKITELTEDSHISYFDFKDPDAALHFATEAHSAQDCVDVAIHIVNDQDDMPEWRVE